MAKKSKENSNKYVTKEVFKGKIDLVEERIGRKIDPLLNAQEETDEYIDELKGNGDLGVWENIRNLHKKVKYIIIGLLVILILIVGGNIEGVSLKKIKEFFTGQPTTTQQVETPASNK